MTNKQMLQEATTSMLALWLANHLTCINCPQKGLCDADEYSKDRCKALLTKWLEERI